MEVRSIFKCNWYCCKRYKRISRILWNRWCGKTFDEIYKVICSENVSNEFNRLHIAVQKSAEYVNVIQTDKKLDCITLILYLIQTGCLQNREQLIENLKYKLEDKVNKFSDKYIFECIEYLESTLIISKDINGNYFTGD